MKVNPTTKQVTLSEIDNLNDLRVVVPSHLRPKLDALLREHRYGRYDGVYAWLDISALRCAGATADKAWQKQFDAMIRYADKHGWLSTDQAAPRVRAHCVDPD